MFDKTNENVWTHPIESATPKNYLEVFTDFYNLRLLVQNDGEYILNSNVKKRLLAFFKKHNPFLLEPKTFEEYNRLVKETSYDKSVEFDLAVLKGTLDGYEHAHDGRSWFDSPDFKSFLHDYQVVTRIIDSYLQSGEIFTEDLQRIDEIGNELLTRKLEPLLRIGEVGTREKINLRETFITETWCLGPPWHGLMIASTVGGAIYMGILRLLLQDLKIKRCALPDCEKIFIPQPRGSKQRFCSVNCRTKAHKREKRKR